MILNVQEEREKLAEEIKEYLISQDDTKQTQKEELDEHFRKLSKCYELFNQKGMRLTGQEIIEAVSQWQTDTHEKYLEKLESELKQIDSKPSKMNFKEFKEFKEFIGKYNSLNKHNNT